MKYLTLNVLCLTLLVSCGEDVGSNNKMGQNRSRERSNQGLGNEATDAIRSSIHRTKGAAILSYAEEIQKTLGRDLPEVNYRIIPLMGIDDEGSRKNVTTQSDLGRPNTNCGTGTGFTGIDARITDCYQKNGDKALWEGYRYGAAGESIWKLVARSGTDKEIWFDARTGMVWSYLIADENDNKLFNWCKASGNTENDSASNAIDCNDIGEGKSLCAGSELPEVGDQVKFRLPTRNDLLQADLNGLRLVLNKESSTAAKGLWTATMRASSADRSQAWVYSSKEGTLDLDSLTSNNYVRCIGAPVR